MKGKVAKLVGQAATRLVEQGVLPASGLGVDLGDPTAIPIDRPKRAEHGDFSTNLALVLAKAAKKPPRAIAQALAGELTQAADLVASADVAGPGFVNVKLHPSAWQAVVGEILANPETFGASARAGAAPGSSVLCEFVSANPTGPLHFAHGRGAVLGDVLARLLTATGHRVTTEYYVNDRGNQVRDLGISVALRYRELLGESFAPPADGKWYPGAYVIDVARALRARDGDAHKTRDLEDPLFRDFAIDAILAGIRADLSALDIGIDHFVSERALTDAGKVKLALDALTGKGLTERLGDGALCFKSGELGDDKDRILVKRDGELTYFATDAAYHLDKIARGFDRLIDVWGADHHGYIARMRAALKAFGHDESRLEVLLIQIVRLVRKGEPVKMSKRAGEFVTLREVFEEVGKDACRFLFLLRRHDSHLDFDLDLAKQKTLDNPVYYVQYGHARLCSILARAREIGEGVPRFEPKLLARLDLPEELAIVRLLASYPDTLSDAADAREPHRIVYYLTELGQAFQSYYTQLWKVRRDPILPLKSARAGDWRLRHDLDKMRARLVWVDAIRQVTRLGLNLLGVSAPERMAELGSEQEEEST